LIPGSARSPYCFGIQIAESFRGAAASRSCRIISKPLSVRSFITMCAS
jgi:hypothetical protein